MVQKTVLALDRGTPTPGGGGCHTVSVLGREEGYMVKYGLSPKACPRAQPEANPEGSGLFLPYPDLSPNTDIIPFLTMIY